MSVYIRRSLLYGVSMKGESIIGVYITGYVYYRGDYKKGCLLYVYYKGFLCYRCLFYGILIKGDVFIKEGFFLYGVSLIGMSVLSQVYYKGYLN